MKKLHNFKWFTLGVIATLIVSLSIPAIAANLTKTATLSYNDIKITLDGGAITPKDANGNDVEPFIIDGTTYLPVRAVAGALGLGVEWDGATNTVKLLRNATPTASQTNNSEGKSGGKVGDYEIYISGARFTNDYNGDKCVVVSYDFTNNSDDNAALMWTLNYKAFQNGIELSNPLMIEGVNHDNKIKEIQPGVTLRGIEIAYTLSDNSDIEIQFDEWISFGNNHKISVALPYSSIAG